MQLRRFTSDSTSKALKAVREAFGDEAVILSNRQVDGQVEIIATGTIDEQALAAAVPGELAAPAPEPSPVAALVPEREEVTVSLSSEARTATSDVVMAPGTTPRASLPGSGSAAAVSSAPEPMTFEQATFERQRASGSTDTGATPKAPSGPVSSTSPFDDATDSGGSGDAAPESALDSLSRDLEAMSGEERPLTLGPVPEVEAREIACEASEEREAAGEALDVGAARAARGGGAEEWPTARPGAPTPPSTDAEAQPGVSTVAAIGQVLAMAERRHAERARRLEQRFLRLEVNLWGELEPLRSAHLRQLVRLGVGTELAVRLVERVTADMTANTAMRQSLALLKATLPVGVDGSGRRPGVTVLSGPAGGGKTTALVKLATQQVRLHGAQSTVLISADSQRIGAFESLQAYGRLLGVPVVQARDTDELAERIHAFAHKPLVLVDHVPLELADAPALPCADSLGDCDGEARELRRLLVLPATLEPCAFESRVAAHAAHGITHAVLTQLDRAVRLASCFAPLIRHSLPIAYVSDHARVLTPLAAADAATLVATAMTRAQQEASGADEKLLLNLLQPTRRVIESVAEAGTAASRQATACASGEAQTASATSNATGSAPMHGASPVRGTERERNAAKPAEGSAAGRAEPNAMAGTAPSRKSDDPTGTALVPCGTLERIVAFEVVDSDSVIENDAALDTIETCETVDLPVEIGPRGRRARSGRRTRRGDNDKTNRQEMGR